MSQFLGRQDSIESLRKDVVDLQGALLDVFSRTGPVRFNSWKFPDKLSCNLDMVALLEKYDFVDGEDAYNQHSHIVLLELLVDRLLLLLQSLNAYVEKIRCSHRRDQTQQKGCLSVGLVVRNYWSNLVQFANLKESYKDTKKQRKVKTLDCDGTETVSLVSPQMSQSRDYLSPWSSSSSVKCLPQSHAPSSSTHNTPCYHKVDSHHVSSQTVESSLVPCNACHQVQSTLIKTGHAFVELLQSESLPSSLQPLLVAVEDTLELGHMTAGDVAQWANEQLRDMRRLMKHLQEVRSTVQPLKERLAAAEAERDRFKSQLERKQKTFKQEMEKHQANIVQLEFSLSKAQRCVKETEQRLQEEQRQLKRETLSMEESHSRLKEKEALWQDALQTLEFENNGLQEKVRALHIEQEACGKLQQRIQELESQICKTQLCLDKENAKYQSACRQQESMQAKQKSLLERVNALDEECEELQGQVGEREERQIVLHNQLLQMSEEKEQMQGQLTQQQDLCSELRREKQTQETHAGELKNSVAELKEYVQTLRERERLLVAFPELNPTAQPQSTGNVLLDMEQQLQANNIRINLLEQENLTLYTSLVKLRERAQHNATGEASPQQTRVLSPSGPSLEKQHHPLTQMQKRSLQSSSAARLGYGNRGKDAQRGESGLESAGSEDRVSPASPYPLNLHLQTLQLDTGSTAAKSQTKTPSSALLSHSRGSNQRKKMKP
ncbi:coiled-coil domain-containing protein 157 isoform X1 [Pseudochaenichthys georgianus]|uniref:coiled-coil domain-containing protein 157 isoform X1 n=1 Tax=Pseudochaenichthys georgianus TaxID=52239 RepID=UPI00146D5666|nr:coiled-coil domain-containing protein 157 [Pseudochaenichthys georgianus]